MQRLRTSVEIKRNYADIRVILAPSSEGRRRGKWKTFTKTDLMTDMAAKLTGTVSIPKQIVNAIPMSGALKMDGAGKKCPEKLTVKTVGTKEAPMSEAWFYKFWSSDAETALKMAREAQKK